MTLTMQDLRKFVDEHQYVDDDTVLLAAESNPSSDFDNSGFPLTKIAYDGVLGAIYLLADGVEYKPNVLEQPMPLHEVREVMDEDNRISVIVHFDFDELCDNDLEGINDLAEVKVVENGVLADISYTVMGHESCGVLVQVDAEVDLRE